MKGSKIKKLFIMQPEINLSSSKYYKSLNCMKNYYVNRYELK